MKKVLIRGAWGSVSLLVLLILFGLTSSISFAASRQQLHTVQLSDAGALKSVRVSHQPLREYGSAKLYVGNLSWNTTDETLRNAFSEYGQVLDAIVIRDRDTGRSRGFGFVTYASTTEADAAIAGMNEQELDGRRIQVNLANSAPIGMTN